MNHLEKMVALKEKDGQLPKKHKKASPLRNLFRRGITREEKSNSKTCNDLIIQSMTMGNSLTGVLFGQPLATVSDNRGRPPEPILNLLKVIWLEGPYVVGIMRKSGNQSACRKAKELLDLGLPLPRELSSNILVASSLVKDFIRNIPGSLMVDQLEEEWMKMVSFSELDDKLAHAKSVLSKMPECNVELLQYFICAMYNISLAADVNRMNALNLAICIAPSAFTGASNQTKVRSLVCAMEFLIANCVMIWGSAVTELLEKLIENSEYIQCLFLQESSGEMLHNSSSVDMHMESSGTLFSSSSTHLMLPSHLTRDSGLSLSKSDTQLYDGCDQSVRYKSGEDRDAQGEATELRKSRINKTKASLNCKRQLDPEESTLLPKLSQKTVHICSIHCSRQPFDFKYASKPLPIHKVKHGQEQIKKQDVVSKGMQTVSVNPKVVLRQEFISSADKIKDSFYCGILESLDQLKENNPQMASGKFSPLNRIVDSFYCGLYNSSDFFLLYGSKNNQTDAIFDREDRIPPWLLPH